MADKNSKVIFILSFLIIGNLFLIIFSSISVLNVNHSGFQQSPNSSEMIAIKTDRVVWYDTWGSPYLDYNFGGAVAMDAVGNIYVTGGIDPLNTGGYYDILITKFYPNGTMIWNVTWGSPAYDVGNGVAVDSDGNVYCVGETQKFGNYDLVLIKTYSNGTIAWNVTWGGSNDDRGSGIAIDSNDNIFCVGITRSIGAGMFDFVLIKFNKNGTKIWEKTWGGSNEDWARGVNVDSAGNIYCVGGTKSYGGYIDFALVKFFPNNTIAWAVTWGGSQLDMGYGVWADSIGNVFCDGYTNSYGNGAYDFLLIKYYSNGTKAWNTTWGMAGEDIAYDIAMDSNGNIYCAGYIEANRFDFALVKFSNSGIPLWNAVWGGGSDDCGFGVVLDNSGNIYVGGITQSYGGGGRDLALVKFAGRVSPNAPTNPYPANGATEIKTTTNLTVIVSDSDGDILNVTFYNAINNSVIGTACNIPSGKISAVSWQGLSKETTYSWYVNVTDGNSTVQSQIWSFTTEAPETAPGEISGYEVVACIIGILMVISIRFLQSIGKIPKLREIL